MRSTAPTYLETSCLGFASRLFIGVRGVGGRGGELPQHERRRGDAKKVIVARNRPGFGEMAREYGHKYEEDLMNQKTALAWPEKCVQRALFRLFVVVNVFFRFHGFAKGRSSTACSSMCPCMLSMFRFLPASRSYYVLHKMYYTLYMMCHILYIIRHGWA